MSTIQDFYQKECVPQLMEQFGYKNIMEVPKLDKIVLNMGLGEGVQNPKSVDLAAQELTTRITSYNVCYTKLLRGPAGL